MSDKAVILSQNTSAAAGEIQQLAAQGKSLKKNDTKPKKADQNILSLQPKLTVGAPDDPFEKQADDMADKVMMMPEQNFMQCKNSSCGEGKIQREEIKTEPEDKSKLKLQLTQPDFISLRAPFFERNAMHLWDPESALGVWKYNFDFFQRFGLDDDWSGKAANLTTPLFINSQLKVQNPTWWEITDKELNTSSIVGSLPIFSFDADFRNWKPLPFLQKKSLDNSAAGINKDSPKENFIQRKCAHCEEEEKINRKPLSTAITPFIQTKTESNIPAVSDSHSRAIQSSKGGGSSLDFSTQNFMSSRFGANFGHVKVHTDREAVQMNRDLNAKAFTVGNDLYFNEGQYQPGSDRGKHLLAHELTHTIQQGAPTQSSVPKDNKIVPESGLNPQTDKKQGKRASDTGKAVELKSKLNAETPIMDTLKGLDPKKKAEMSSVAENIIKEQKGKKNKDYTDELKASAIGKLFKENAINPLTRENDQKKDVAGGVSSGRANASLKGKINEVKAFIDAPFQFKITGKEKGNPDLLKKKTQADTLGFRFIDKAGIKLNTAIASIQTLTPSLIDTADVSKSAIGVEMIARLAETASGIIKMKGDAKKHTGGVVSVIKLKHAAAVSSIKKANGKATEDLKIAYDAALKLCNENVFKQLPAIDHIYEDAAVKFKQAGVIAGDHAITIANQHAAVYQGRVTGESDGVLDGPYTSDQYEARAKAAREVGKQYKDGKGGLVDSGKKQADVLLNGPGKDKDRETVNETGKTIREALKQNYDAAINSVITSQSQAVENADKTKKGLIDAANKALKSTISALAQQEAAQVKIITGLAIGLSDNIDNESTQIMALINNATIDATSQILFSLTKFRQDAQNNESPHPEMLSAHLQPARNGFDIAVTRIQNGIYNGVEQSIKSLMKGTEIGLSEMQTNALTGLAQARDIAEGLKPILTGLSTSATSSFKKLQTVATTSIHKTATDSGKAFHTQATGITETFRLMNEALTKGLLASSKEVENAFNTAVDKDIYDVIISEAEKAASQISPRWKKIAKILLVIIVIVVVALVVGPAVIGFVAGAATALGAGAAAATIGAVVGGAIVGAAAGAVIQAGNNLIDGKPVLEGVGKAALIGAVSGALGGAGGALGQFISKGAQGLAPAAMRFGADLAFDVGGNIGMEAVQAIMEGRSINWGDIATSAALSAGMSIGMSNIGKLPKLGAKIGDIQSGSMKFGEGIGVSAGGTIKTKFGAPNIDAPSLKVTTEATAVKTSETKPANQTTTKADDIELGGPKSEMTTPTKPDAEVEFAKTDTDSSLPKTDVTEQPKLKIETEVKTPDAEKAKQISKDAQTDEGIVAKGKAEDGHEFKVDKEGNIVKCSECEVYELTQKKLLDKHPDLADELKAIRKKMAADPDDQLVMKELEAFDTKMKDTENFAKAKQDVLDNNQIIDDAYAKYKDKKKANGVKEKDIRDQNEWFNGKLNEATGKSKGGFENTLKGRVGEHQADVHLKRDGFKKLSNDGKLVDPKDPPLGKGIDGVWEKDGFIYITETKYGSSKLTARQKTKAWLDQNIAKLDVKLQAKVKTAILEGKLRKIVLYVDDRGVVIKKDWN